MIRKMEHVAIIVNDMDTSIGYYEDLFGFVLRLRGSNDIREMAFLYLPDTPDVEIELIRDLNPTETYAEVSVVNHLAFTVDNIEETITAFQDKGIAFLSEETKPTLDGGKMILFKGPSGEMLQLVERGK
ncbi:VOC family protein [Geomicrobium sp. JSM 1781026]|uniref:VOC family protein n=1 Tax=Geomicrobium sp. JSM 1781026 TaxID=3344580 RepID=UPI0035BEEA5F